jgi:hypothetical protein
MSVQDTKVAEAEGTTEAPVESKPVESKEEVAPQPKETAKEETLGEALKVEDKKDNIIPESAFLSEKKARKQAEKRIKELESLIEEGATKGEISDDIESIAKEHNIDEKFLKKLASSIRKEVEGEIEEKVSKKSEVPLEERIEKKFAPHFDKIMEDMSEYKGIVNREAIKELSLLKKNESKTLRQLIEETYSGSIRGRKTIESTVPRGGKSLETVDFERAHKDEKYFEQIMSDPESKKRYNDNLVSNIRL